MYGSQLISTSPQHVSKSVSERVSQSVSQSGSQSLSSTNHCMGNARSGLRNLPKR